MIECYNPTCKKIVPEGGPYVSFCSDECRRAYWKEMPEEDRIRPHYSLEEVIKRIKLKAKEARLAKGIPE